MEAIHFLVKPYVPLSTTILSYAKDYGKVDFLTMIIN